MGISAKDKKAFEDYKTLCKIISDSTSVKLNETSSQQEARIKRLLGNYGEFFEYYFGHYAKRKDGTLIPCAKFQTREAMAALKDPFYTAAWVWYRGAAKSVHADIGLPVFLKENNELNFMVLVGDTDPKACKLIGSLQAEFEENKLLLHDFGKQFSYGSWAEGEFQTLNGTSFFALGVGQSPRGIREREKRPDLIIPDDIDTRERCRNPKLVKEAAEWVQEDLMGCFGGERERFIVPQNLFDEVSILSTLHKEISNLKWVQVNAIDKEGNPSWPERSTKEYWERKRASKPMRSWLREYMNTPIKEGAIFKDEWIQWTKVLPLDKYEYLIAYCDPSFKNTKNSDYKAIKLWGKSGTKLHLIKCFVRQATVGAMVNWFYDLHEAAKGAIIDYFIEANMLQDLLLDAFTEEGNRRGYQIPIRPDKRAKPDKFSRIEATSPLYERGFVYYNEALKENADMKTAISQLLAFEKGSNAPDDSPDADEGAIFLMQKRTRTMDFVPILGMRQHPKNSY
jgi:predicted phage terminase large subunit-like protein